LLICWDKWKYPATGELVVSFSMLTVNADEHEVMQQFHRPGDEKRTPVIIPQEDYIQWLGTDVPIATQMLSWTKIPALLAAPQPKAA
jgi:putative SOS response-associated peptidase YedK